MSCGPAPQIVKTRIARYERKAIRSHCPDCGSPLLVAYEGNESRHGLEAVLICAADCGYTRHPLRITHGHGERAPAA